MPKKIRKQKVNKYAEMNPIQAELDFHDRGKLYPEDIEEICENFLAHCKRRKMKKVLIITGKGLHSSDGVPVVKPCVVRFLKNDKRVSSFIEARRDRGGSGALEVELN